MAGFLHKLNSYSSIFLLLGELFSFLVDMLTWLWLSGDFKEFKKKKKWGMLCPKREHHSWQWICEYPGDIHVKEKYAVLLGILVINFETQ